jgi:hypothetical protein
MGWNEQAYGVGDARALIYRRPALKGENFPVDECTGIVQPSTGVLQMGGLMLQQGVPVTTLYAKTGTTAGAGTTHLWAGIWSGDATDTPDAKTTEVVSAVRTSGSPTLTIPSAANNSKVGRKVTGSGMPVSPGRAIDQPTDTTITLSGNASSSGTSNVTFGEYHGPRQNLAYSPNSTTPPTADTFVPFTLSRPFVPAGTGLYLAGLVHANTAGTQPNWCAKALPAACGTSTLDHVAHSNAGPHTTPPGAANPLASITAVVNWIWFGWA